MGFTLIELLAVIVILAIIAVIAIPILLNIIEKTRQGAFVDSTYGIVEATKLNLLELTSSNKKITYPIMYSYKNGILYDSLGNKISMSNSIKSGNGKIIYYSVNEFELALHNNTYCSRYTNLSKEVEVANMEDSCRLSFEEGIIVYDLSVSKLENNASLITNRYDTEKIYVSGELPNIDSSITYEVRIANYSNILYDLSNIVVELDNNDLIKYEITGIKKGDMIEPNTIKKINIKLSYETSVLPTNTIETLELKFKFEEHIASYVVDTYEYTGNYEEFIAPYNGIYKIELWGAQGGPNSREDLLDGGLGAYTSGEINLNKGTKLYIYIGENGYMPDNVIKPFNGGGAPDTTGTWELSYIGTYSGGGASDVRIVAGNWDNFDSLKSRIMVAAGGSGGNNGDGTKGGAGGGLFGLTESNKELVKIPTQTFGYSFGIGQDSGVYPTQYTASDGKIYVMGADTGAGGGGYYGGYRGYDHNSGGSSGTSFISGHTGCDAISSSSTITNIIHTGQSIHYSGYQFNNTIIIDGEGYNWTTERKNYTGMPSHDSTTTMIGNSGDGYAKITFIERRY